MNVLLSSALPIPPRKLDKVHWNCLIFSLEISSKTVAAELYKTAFALQMTPVVKACACYLTDNFNLKNFIGVRRQANFNDDVYLLGKVDNFTKENFAKIVGESVEFTHFHALKLGSSYQQKKSKPLVLIRVRPLGKVLLTILLDYLMIGFNILSKCLYTRRPHCYCLLSCS
ncbi:hypothetical protein OESDEN_04517 [Oesophagostomum dentatum]|uniref:Uncharacterized protein n=1 Tax=Oesophagostomum dentatum TaxID=61180 RepID=A0A0B1TDB5_OESDE|nr:hypothetical protein OESDEN_04517 [Oesophagostomum dentatum]